MNRRHILFVDDDSAFLETVSQLFLAWSQGTWEVHLASTTAKALQLLQAHPVDLAVMDIQMPVMDGIQFLALLNRKCPSLRKVVMTGFGSDEYRAACLRQGAELFLEKPRTSEGYETVFATLNELASLQQQEGFRGVLRQVGLPDLIQMECLSRSSSVLEIANGQVRGLIYIEHGAIVHAELGQTLGESAFNNLLCLRGGEFNLKPFSAPPQRSITGQWEFLLMEAAHMRDELAELAEPVPGSAAPAMPGAITEPTAPSIAESLPPGCGEVQTPAAPAEGTTTIDELVVCSGQSEVLYEWQCQDVEDRLKLLNQIAQKAEHCGQMFALGRFDRMEAVGAQGRFVAQMSSGQKLFVRCSRPPAALDTAESNE